MSMAPTYKVIVIDDAKFMVKAITDILQSDGTIQVIDSARNGQEGLEKIRQHRPDVVTLDMDMPVMDGISTIRHIMIQAPVPIVVLSSLFKDGAITFEALRLGAVDFMPKPSGAISYDIHRYQQQIMDRVKIATAVNLHNIRRVRLMPANPQDNFAARYAYQSLDYLIAIGTTLGGPNTSIRLFSKLSPRLPAAAIMMQEISPKVVPAFVKKFDAQVSWTMQEAEDGMVLQPGHCYLCSNEYSLRVMLNDQGEPCLQRNDPIARPLDQLFQTAAHCFRQNTIGILLTGIGDDGTQGFKAIRAQAGVTIAQATHSCVYPNLTQSVIAQQSVDWVVEEPRLAEVIEAAIQQSKGLD